MPFKIVRNDIVKMKTDAIVNTADPDSAIGSGADSTIYEKAGGELLKFREKIGKIKPGEAFISPGFKLKAKFIIHTSSPVWIDGLHNEENILASCYRNSLYLAKENNLKSISFPLIAAENYGFPKEIALETAVKEISSFLAENDMLIYLAVFEKSSFRLSESLFLRVKSFIDENYLEEKNKAEYGKEYYSDERILSTRCSAPYPSDDIEGSLFTKEELDNRLKNLDIGFSEALLKLIDESGKTDPEIYKRVNIDRKLFSKIKNDPKYRPSKITAVAFALALELNLKETNELIGRAGYALTNSSKFDVIVMFFIENENFDIFKLNEVLFSFDQPLIG